MLFKQSFLFLFVLFFAQAMHAQTSTPAAFDINVTNCPTAYPNSGDDFIVDFTVTNTGGTPSDPTPLYLEQLGDDITQNEPTVKILGTVNLPSIGVGETYSLSKNFGPIASMPRFHAFDLTTWSDFALRVDYPSSPPFGQTFENTFDPACKKFNSGLEVEVTADSYLIDPSGHLEYDITVTNTGEEQAANVMVHVGPQSYLDRYVITLINQPADSQVFVERPSEDESLFLRLPLLDAGTSETFHVNVDVVREIDSIFDPNVFVYSEHQLNGGDYYDINDAVFYREASGSCSAIAGFTKLGEFNGHGYYMSDASVPWAQAKTLAENAGGYLVTMNDQAENDFVKVNLNNTMVFIGYNDATTENVGQWANNEPVTLDLSYANSAANDYAVMNFWAGTWQMEQAGPYRKFVMEMDCRNSNPSNIIVGNIICPSSFPSIAGSIDVAVNFTNTGGQASSASTYAFGQDKYGGGAPIVFGEFNIPALAANESIIVTKDFALNSLQIPIEGAFGNKNFWIAKSPLYDNPTYLDFYCKKTATDLVLELSTNSTNYIEQSTGAYHLEYDVVIRNDGPETAYNVLLSPGLTQGGVVGVDLTYTPQPDLTYDHNQNAYLYLSSLASGASKTYHVAVVYHSPLVSNEILVNVGLTSGHNMDPNPSNNTGSLVFVSGGGATCGNVAGFTKLGEFNGHGYYMSDASVPWTQAKTLAENAGGYLVTMNDQAENDFVKANLNSTMVFIGYNDATNEGVGQWANNEPVTLDLSYNNSATNDYAVMNFWAGTWQLEQAGPYRKFVMEMDCGATSGANLVVSPLSCSDDFPIPGQPFTLSVTVTNSGGQASVAKSLSFMQDYTMQGGSPISFGSFNVPVLQPGETVTLTQTFNMTGMFLPGSYTNLGTSNNESYGGLYVTFDSGEYPAHAQDYYFYCKKFNGDLALQITPNGNTYSPGANGQATISYDITVTNNGPEMAYNLMANVNNANPVPSANSVSVTPSTTEIVYGQNGAMWYIPSLAVGESKTISVDYTFGFPGGNLPANLLLDLSVVSGHNTNPSPISADNAAFSLDGGTASCGNIQGFIKLGEYNGHGYYLSDASASWSQAKTLAENAGGYLATMNDQVENDFVQANLGGELVFIGYNDAVTEGVGSWATTEPVTLDLSYGNSPENDYAVMNFWAGTWQMVNQWVAKKYIMEMNCTTPQPASIARSLLVAKAVNIHDVYPNPAMDNITIRVIAPEEKSSQFNVYDGRGQLLLSEKRDLPQGSSEVEFDLSDLPAGMYFVKEAGALQYYNFVIMR